MIGQGSVGTIEHFTQSAGVGQEGFLEEVSTHWELNKS